MSSSLRALGASFAFSDAVPLFSDVSFHLTPGWTGLVGPNGAGKSTLLRLIAGELHPSSGSFKFEPARPVVRLCPQEVEDLNDAVQSFKYDPDSLAHRIRGQLRLDPLDVDRWPTLSPGERKRWQIGAALAATPDFLLLDEPTNHLDSEATAWLVGALRRFRGVGVVVSHDRGFLDALTTATLRIDGESVRLWPGSYSAALEQWEAERAAQREAYVSAKEAHAAAERRLREARAQHDAAMRQRSAGARMRSKYDSDARGMGADFRVSTAEKRLGRNVGVIKRDAERKAAAVGSFEFEKELGRSVFAGYAPCPKPVVLRLDRRTLHAGDKLVVDGAALQLHRSERIHLAGVNGAGKTTLVRALLEDSALPPDRVLYLPQDTTDAEATDALARLKALPSDVRGRVLSLVAALGVDPDRLLRTERPSPGEARKLLLAEGLGNHVWALVLDEPTNHLDLPSIERVEAALVQWPGALLLVTHDAPLAERTCSTRWLLDAGDVRVSTIG